MVASIVGDATLTARRYTGSENELRKSEKQMLCILDYETRSRRDLRKSGGFEYAADSSTEILCAAFRIGKRDNIAAAPIHSWSPFIRGPRNDTARRMLLSAMKNKNVLMVAHNAFFERAITYHRLGVEVPADRWVCTAAQAAASSLPRGLEDACHALDLPAKKDMIGRRLMLKMTKPRKATKRDASEWHMNQADLWRLIEYCKADIEAETHLFLNTKPLSGAERCVWLLDQRLNWEGFRIDRDLVNSALDLIRQESENLTGQFRRITGLNSPNQVGAFRKWLADSGIFIPSLSARDVSEILKTRLDAPVRRALEIRQALSKSSTKKYEAFDARASATDDRVRDILLYHGAIPTARWAGRGVQPQNFPRGSIKDTGALAADIKTGSLDWIRLLYGEPMNAFSSALRGVIIPTSGKEFVCADFASIEVRVLFWLAGHTKGVDLFMTGGKIYEEMAAKIYHLPVDQIKNPSIERHLGKETILGCGFGMGEKKFYENTILKGIPISRNLAKEAVNTYRAEHSPVVDFWRDMDTAAIRAVMFSKKGKTDPVQVGHLSWRVEGRFLYCRLPSGKDMPYFKPDIEWADTPWGERRPRLVYMGIDPQSKQMRRESTYGGKLVENAVQATARELMVAAMLRTESASYTPVLTVHDELLAEQIPGRPLKDFVKLFESVPKWAAGCPIKSEGWNGDRYRK